MKIVNETFCEGFTIYIVGFDDVLYYIDTQGWEAWNVLMPCMMEEEDALEKYIFPIVEGELLDIEWRRVTIN